MYSGSTTAGRSSPRWFSPTVPSWWNPATPSWPKSWGYAARPSGGITTSLSSKGGPAGLTVGLYAAREGIKTLIIERSGVGGQAGITQEIENYPGFPEAVSGADLSDRLRR